MKKIFSLFLLQVSMIAFSYAQHNQFWHTHDEVSSKITKDKAVNRSSFPSTFKLFDLNLSALNSELQNKVVKQTTKSSTIISIPNADGNLEQFEVVEASNFDAALQARFPQIRAFSGRGIADKAATLKLSIAPTGVQAMVFRIGQPNEFIEAYSKDHTVYAVYQSQKNSGIGSWNCSTQEAKLANDLNTQVYNGNIAARSGGDLKVMRLAQSVTAEYSNYFGATSAAQESLVLTAVNNTLTRCNGVYEKDLALHLNLVAASTSVFYYNPSTDPYSAAAQGAGGAWNNELQNTLTSVIGNANYDIGHLFGATGGGGNAGCIGCVCGTGKGSGYTSPQDGIPQGDKFDIDYVVHEVGHQLGANHTFSFNNEGTGVNKEVGSGLSIMGYAGITNYDVAPNSIEYFHQASIAQIQANLATKTCPVTTSISNATPVVAALTNYTIPKSTPFALTGSATDANASDVLTYSWEQNDNAGNSQTNASSVASVTKATGPNWTNVVPTTSPTRLFPKLATILAGGQVTGPNTGGDAGANTEALSSVARTLNFRLTVRDNAPYSSTSPVSVGQTQFADMVVTVSSASGPFDVTAPNTAINWNIGSAQNVTWNVNGTTASPVSCANVKISLSTDGGNNFTTLVASTANDGSETITVPNTPSSTCRIKVEAVGNIFFDISNANFTIGGTAPACGDATGLSTTAITNTSATFNWGAVTGTVNYTVDYKLASSTTWTSAATATTATSINVTGLTANTAYNWRVRANCNGASGNFVSANFSTTAPASTCPGPLDVSTNGAASGAATIPFNTDVKGTISSTTDNDYYKFVITTGGTATITLSTLPADFDIRLYSSNGTSQLAISQNGSTTSESISRTYTAGTYYVRVYGYNGANSSTCYTLRVALGTASKMENAFVLDKTQVAIYPNPVKDELKINTNSNNPVTVSIVDMYGKKVVTKNVTSLSTIDMSGLSSGIYLVTLLTEKGEIIKQEKIVKQ
jgi:hypothetical protein